MKQTLFVIALSGAMSLLWGNVLAAGTSSSSDSQDVAKDLKKAEQLIESGDMNAAIPVLRDVLEVEDDNADAYNYLGYTHRKLGQYDKSKQYYDKALEIDPEHTGAREYLGELYLKLGKLEEAQEQLARLDEICTFGCSEYDDLKHAIEEYQQSQ